MAGADPRERARQRSYLDGLRLHDPEWAAMFEYGRAMERHALRTRVSEPDLEALTGAVARGWCHPETSDREMDADLAEAIVDEVLPLLIRARGGE